MDLNAFCEAMPVCLEWIAETQLKDQANEVFVVEETGENDVIAEITSEKAFKVILASITFLATFMSSTARQSKNSCKCKYSFYGFVLSCVREFCSGQYADF